MAKKTLEELSAELDLEVRHIPVEGIQPDPDNANEMDAGLYDTLVADIKQFGFTQPILVRPVGEDRFQLIDGEHRWRAVTELGFATVPAVVIDADDDEAKIRLLTMNRLRGTFVPIKLAYVIADLATRIPEKELRKRLGMESGELTDNLRLANFKDELSENLRRKTRKTKRSKVTLRFTMAKEDADAINRVVDALSTDKMERGEALALICREFERANRVEGTTTLKPPT